MKISVPWDNCFGGNSTEPRYPPFTVIHHDGNFIHTSTHERYLYYQTCKNNNRGQCFKATTKTKLIFLQNRTRFSACFVQGRKCCPTPSRHNFLPSSFLKRFSNLPCRVSGPYTYNTSLQKANVKVLVKILDIT